MGVRFALLQFLCFVCEGAPRGNGVVGWRRMVPAINPILYSRTPLQNAGHASFELD